MAMIKCPECGQEISESIKICPNCGVSIKSKKSVMKFIVAIVVMLILIVCIGIIINFNRLDENEKEDVLKVCDAISEIGEVSEYSEMDIENAEKLYKSLSKKCQRHVDNYDTLIEARESYNKLKADETINLISEIGKVTIDSQSLIDKAQESYDELTKDQKALVTNSDDLTEAKKQISSLKIEDTCEKINNIGEVKLDSKENIKIARKSYDNLSDDEKSKISNYDNLTAAEEKYNEIAVNESISLIDAIGQVTLDSKESIDNATNFYNSLPEELRKNVTNYDKLKASSSEYQNLKLQEEEKKKTLNNGDTFTTSNWEITYNRANISAKITPDNTSGGYLYYYAESEDATFIDIVFKIKNINTDILGIEELVSNCRVKYDDKNLTKSYTLYTSNGSQIDKVYSWDGLDALDSTTLHVAINMPREIQSNNKPITVNLTIAGADKIINIR